MKMFVSMSLLPLQAGSAQDHQQVAWPIGNAQAQDRPTECAVQSVSVWDLPMFTMISVLILLHCFSKAQSDHFG
jgi:hypothetical protein